MADRQQDQSREPRQAIALSQGFVIGLFIFLLLGAGALITLPTEQTLRAAGMISAFLVAAMFPMALKASSPADGPSPRESMDRISKAVERLTHEGGLSETAKRVLHRKQERNLLRQAIEHDIQDGDYDAAMTLVHELAERFGYRADAEEFRARIERVRAQSQDAMVVTALESLDGMIRQRRWAEAFAEAARITRLYPDSHRVIRLRERVEESKHRYKLDLERRFLGLAQREQVEDAMSVLKELDQYLTEAEAEPFREVARGVIGKARDNLGVRFKIAVQDRNWHEALDVGERIIAEFPNSRMAQEVREMLDTLRERANHVRGGRPIAAAG